jgi:hypothetical protein
MGLTLPSEAVLRGPELPRDPLPAVGCSLYVIFIDRIALGLEALLAVTIVTCIVSQISKIGRRAGTDRRRTTTGG